MKLMPWLILTRFAEVGDFTFGRLHDVVENRGICVTAERRWCDNKIGESCIPIGNYDVERYVSARFGLCYRFHDDQTEPRTAIRWHAGNVPHRDSTGCILPGKVFGLLGSDLAVLHSRRALNDMLAAYEHGFSLEIKQAV